MVKLIVLTGVTCNGKTYIATELRKRFGWYVIYTDLYYHPMKGKPPKTLVGEESTSKVNYIKQYCPYLTETTIVEGSHIGNKAEVELFKKYLGFKGNVYIFRVENQNFNKWYKEKYSEGNPNKIISWFNSIHDLEVDKVVSSTDEVIKFLESKDVHIPR